MNEIIDWLSPKLKICPSENSVIIIIATTTSHRPGEKCLQSIYLAKDFYSENVKISQNSKIRN